MARRIPKDQIDVKNFSCIRLKDNSMNKSLIQGFNSTRNWRLSFHLQRQAYHEDKTNRRAYYLVKDGNKIVLFFSLQCGQLIRSHRKVVGGIMHQSVSPDSPNMEYLIKDDKIDVTEVLPGLEIAHFCVNDSYRRRKASWKVTYGICDYTVGTYAFYKFIAPQILSVAEISGLQYVYLFCADDGSNKLSQYYADELHFRAMDNMACIRSEYDESLPCMTIKIETLGSDLHHFQDMGKAESIIEFLQNNRTISCEQAKKHFNVSDPQWLLRKMVEGEVAELDSGSLQWPVRVAKKSKM